MNFSFTKNKIFLIFAATIFSIFLSKILWLKINIPLDGQSKALNIVGAYTKANYNPINEILRYLTFICIPLLVFFISINFFFKNNLVKLKEIIFYNDFTHTEEIKKNFKLHFLLALVFIISILGFTSNDFPAGKIDILHEGQRMIAAINYIANKGLWLSSFMTVGIFYEVLQTLIGFNLFDYQTIGSRNALTIAESDVAYAALTDNEKAVYQDRVENEINSLVADGYIKIDRNTQDVNIVAEKASL